MAFSVSSLTKFTDEVSQDLVRKSVISGRTINLVKLVPGIKYKETLNLIDNTISVQNATCGWSSNGSVAITQRVIEVTSLEIKETLCKKTLEQYFLGQSMKPGSPDDLDLGQVLAESYISKVKKYNELQIWAGTTASGKIDGLLNKIVNDSNTVNVSGYTASFTSSTIIAGVDKVVATLPEDILDRDDLAIFGSLALYNMYTAALRTANLYQGDVGNNGDNFSCKIPGTSVTFYGTAGLTGKNYLVGTYLENLVVGTDLMNEEDNFKIWYSQDNDEGRVLIQWKLGVQYYFPEFIVINKA